MGNHVGDDVAVQVHGHDHVVPVGTRCQQRRADVDDLVLRGNIWIFFGNTVEGLVKQSVGLLHDVVFAHARHLLAAVGTGVLEGVADNLLTARHTHQLERLHHVGGLLVLNTGIKILLVLADDDHVDVWVEGLDVRIERLRWTHVRKKTQCLADRHIQTLVPASLRGSNWCLQENRVSVDDLPRLGRNTRHVALQVDFLAGLNVIRLYGGTGRFQDSKGSVHDFGANTVAAGHRNTGLLHDDRLKQ